MAHRFYLEGKSKIEIAAEFGISRFKVARALETAIQDGLVRIEIRLPSELHAELSDAVRGRFGLAHAVVIQSPQDTAYNPDLVTRRLGAVAADLLAEIVVEDDILGLIWGPEMEALSLELTELAPCTVVQLCGVSPMRPVDASSVEVARRAAAISGGPVFPLYAPLLLPDAATALTLRSQPGIVEAVSRFNQVTKAVVTVGAWGPGLSTIYDSISEEEREEYRRRGVCAEVSSRLLDCDGVPLQPGVADRAISISLEELDSIPEVILLADGRQRAAATKAALKTGIFNGIVTDSDVAHHLLG
jgi:DNA-binding transcriptional regulator LsrR (DeoR family)